MQKAQWTFPVPQTEPQSSEPLRFTTTGPAEKNAIEFDRAALEEVSRILTLCDFPATPLVEIGTVTKEKISKLCDAFERLRLRHTNSFLGAMISHLPWNVLQGMLFSIFSMPAEKFLRTLSARTPIGSQHGGLSKILLNNVDAIHQSLLITQNHLVHSVAKPHIIAQNILPTSPVYNPKSNYKVIPAFQTRVPVGDEKRHPYLDRLEETFYNGPSVVPDLKRFKLNVKIFSMGLIDSSILKSGRALLGGSMMTACLTPWPSSIEKAYAKRQKYMYQLVWIFSKIKVAKDVIKKLIAIDCNLKRMDLELNGLLWNHFHGANSVYVTSDIDINFLASNESAFPMVADQVWTISQKIMERRGNLSLADLHELGMPSLPVSTLDLDLLKTMPCLRTINSITIPGSYPLRHIQLCIGVCRHPSELFSVCDLDCTCVCYDGDNVYYSPRALRAFNLKTNFVGPRELQNPETVNRMMKYRARGFRTMLFEVCKHLPRCDVQVDKLKLGIFQEIVTLGRNYRIHRNFPRNIEENINYIPVSIAYGPNSSTQGLNFNLKSDWDTWVILENMTRENFKLKLISEISEKPMLKGVKWRIEKDLSISDMVDRTLQNRACHMCQIGKPMVGRLCSSCDELNSSRRDETLNLAGKVAVVTGGRNKIGFQTAVKLLRSGCTVYITTRFPRIASKNYQDLPDSSTWLDRLHIIPIDLRDIKEVLKMCEFFKLKVEKLDFLINNAAQTIQKPAVYWEQVLRTEATLTLTENIVDLESFKLKDSSEKDLFLTSNPEEWNLLGTSLGINLNQVHRSAIMSQIQSSHTKFNPEVVFPMGVTDLHSGDPLDLRPETSWSVGIDNIPRNEIIEVLIINTLVPALMIQNLSPVMSRDVTCPRFIVNVTSGEGYSPLRNSNELSGNHPHTNMAKSALNRLTETIAQDYAKKGIYVTAVDPGWISIMQPLTTPEMPSRVVSSPPLTVEDGAARVLDPIFSAEIRKVFWSGVILKNFRPVVLDHLK